MGVRIFAADITFLLCHVLFLLTLPSFQTSPKLIWYDFLSCISCVAAAQQANHYLRMSPFYLGPAGSKSTQTLGGRSSGWVFSSSTSPFCWTLGLHGSLSLISICRSWFGIETVVSLQRFLSINPLRIDEFKILFKSECYDGITGSIPCSWINCIYTASEPIPILHICHLIPARIILLLGSDFAALAMFQRANRRNLVARRANSFRNCEIIFFQR